MDSLSTEHSDSDSCESWTVMESNLSYGEEVLEFPCEKHLVSNAGINLDKDYDTDDISIISDSDHEPSTPCVHLSHEDLDEAPNCAQDSCPTDEPIPQCTFDDLLVSHTQNSTAREDEVFLSNNTGKLRTYVHKRNKRLSTVLNIIVLGSIITAAGVAIGHMWGVRDDLIHSTPSVNKILSNLYKLQEENAYLRSKIKELTMLSNANLQRGTKQMKHQRCKKVFEESLTSENVDKLTKCVEYEDASAGLKSHMIQPEYEKDFLSDIDKLKNVYQQNKSWLDEEIARRQKNEKHSINKIKAQLKNLSNEKAHKHDIAENINISQPTENLNDESNLSESIDAASKRISYADSLKSENFEKRRNKRDSYSDYYRQHINDHGKKRKINKDTESIFETTMSEDDITKDDRYNQMKHNKYDKKKNNHQKQHKKQKRRNKYEQWEMKGGYMKDYDEISIESQENGFILVNNENKPNKVELNNYTQQLLTAKKKDGNRGLGNVDNERCRKDGRRGDEKDRWFERRAAQRVEARRRLERELFEREPSAAAWYFRRMQRRERTTPYPPHALPTLDNTTRKNSKRQKNYKTKH